MQKFYPVLFAIRNFKSQKWLMQIKKKKSYTFFANFVTRKKKRIYMVNCFMIVVLW